MHQHFELGAQDTNTLLNIPIWLGPMWSNSRRQHTHLTALFPGVPRWAGTRKVKPIWILLKRDSEWQWHQLGHVQVSTSLQTDNHASTPPLFYRPDALPAAEPTASKHWRHARWSNSRRRQVKQNMRACVWWIEKFTDYSTVQTWLRRSRLFSLQTTLFQRLIDYGGQENWLG